MKQKLNYALATWGRVHEEGLVYELLKQLFSKFTCMNQVTVLTTARRGGGPCEGL